MKFSATFGSSFLYLALATIAKPVVTSPVDKSSDNAAGLSANEALITRVVDPINWDSINCAYGKDTDRDDLLAGMQHFRDRSGEKWHIRAGKGVHGLGQGSCDRLWCRGKTAIYLCNDLAVPLDLPYGWLADNIEGIYAACIPRGYHGQIFSQDRWWNVIASGDGC